MNKTESTKKYFQECQLHLEEYVKTTPKKDWNQEVYELVCKARDMAFDLLVETRDNPDMGIVPGTTLNYLVGKVESTRRDKE